MKQLTITRLTETGRIAAVQVPTILNEAGIAFQPIDELNWSEYPYKPKVEFRIAHTGHSLLLHYRVTEQSVRAVAESDNGRVWEDACCEFFIQPNLQEPVYYNFECNCAGTLLLNCGKVGDRHPAPKEVFASIDRWSSLGREPFEERIGECSWELALVIPASALFNDTITDFGGRTLHGNFYKCGDLLQVPHFLSWNPIQLPKPCFHCPEFFGELIFKK